jgi:hypothetical protein
VTGLAYKQKETDADTAGNGEAAALKDRPPRRAAKPAPTFAASHEGTITGQLEQYQTLPGVPPVARRVGKDGLPAYLAPPGRSVRQPKSEIEDKNYDEPTPQADLPPPRNQSPTQSSPVPPAADHAVPQPKPPVPVRSEPEDEAPEKLDGKLDAKLDGKLDEKLDAKHTEEEQGTEGPPAEAGGEVAPAGKDQPGAKTGEGKGNDGKGSGQSKRKRKRDDEDLTPFQPLPEVDRGTVTLDRPNIQIDTEAPQFDAPRSLAIATRKSAEKLEGEKAGYAAIYGQAAAASHALYARIVGALQGQTAQARSDADRASTSRQRELDE